MDAAYFLIFPPSAGAAFSMILTREVVTCRVKMDIKIWCPWTSEARTKLGRWASRAALRPARHAAANAA
nr:MAG TPA: hypothetical protein [Caudoviricetes sp.]